VNGRPSRPVHLLLTFSRSNSSNADVVEIATVSRNATPLDSIDEADADPTVSQLARLFDDASRSQISG
jgi:hypothetical protein